MADQHAIDTGRASRPRGIYLVATAGHPNYGDELITANWLRLLAARVPDCDVWVDCHSPGPAAALLGGLHPRARFVDTLWRLCWAAPSDEPWEVAAWVRRAVHDRGLAPRWSFGVDLLHMVDLVHVLGGGYISARWPRHVGLLAGVAAVAGSSGARAALTGHGLVPVSDDTAPLVARLVDRFDIVDVRDEASGQLLRDGGVSHATISSDDSFLGLDVLQPAAPDVPEVMLCLQSDMLAAPRSRLAGLVSATLRAWRVPAETVGVVEGIPGADREIFAMLEHELAGARFYPFADLWREGLPVSAGQTWLSTRFHLHLLAAAAGASGAAIPVSPDYYLTKHRSLVNLGSRWTLAEDWSVPTLPIAGGFPPEVVSDCRAEKLRQAEAIYGPAG